MRWAVAVVLAVVLLSTGIAFAGPLPGAAFTTNVNGDRVDQNIYLDKADVYGDGGPGSNAPSTAAGLPEGDYYFMVTDPPGQTLLSVDPITSRKFHVNAAGVIDYVYPALVLTKYQGKWYGTHLTGVDTDHSELGAITVQLMPYSDTPNMGGVYKWWVTPVAYFTPGQGKFGFLPAWSKTDNFKVKKGKPYVPPVINILKFDDKNANGIWDAGEPELNWQVDVTDPLAVTNTVWTPATVMAVPSGIWTTTEATPTGWAQTCVYVDNVKQTLSATTTVNVVGTSGETHTIVYGNIQLGKIYALKYYDKSGDGVRQANEPLINWPVWADGYGIDGNHYLTSGNTGTTGICWYVMPGDYTVGEFVPNDGKWFPTTPTSYSVTVEEGGQVCVEFGNVKVCHAAFDTKGYCHNKNGLAETTLADLAYLNSLLPWQAPSSYFGAGDEPINGLFANGTPVPAAKGDWGEVIAPAGSPWAEQSAFLIDPNTNGDPREQLAEQLDAFIMNVLHRLGGTGTAFYLPGTGWVVAGDLIDDAVDVWATGTADERHAMEALLDALNNSGDVTYICPDPFSSLALHTRVGATLGGSRLSRRR